MRSGRGGSYSSGSMGGMHAHLPTPGFWQLRLSCKPAVYSGGSIGSGGVKDVHGQDYSDQPVRREPPGGLSKTIERSIGIWRDLVSLW
jgi:hypothetical protein